MHNDDYEIPGVTRKVIRRFNARRQQLPAGMEPSERLVYLCMNRQTPNLWSALCDEIPRWLKSPLHLLLALIVLFFAALTVLGILAAMGVILN